MYLQRAAVAMLLAAGLAACTDEMTTAPKQSSSDAQQIQAARQTASIVENVTGLIPGGTFTGTIRITQFAISQGQLVVSGVLNGVATIGGVPTNIVNQAFTVAANLTSTGPTCDILHLDLGPIFLDLLGLQVDLSRIVLDVAAQPGPGNLLGNLLCAVARLLDNPLASLTGLLQLLDQINNLLG